MSSDDFDKMREEFAEAFSLEDGPLAPDASKTPSCELEAIDLRDDSVVASLRLPSEGAWVGRASSSALRLPHEHVSARHAFIGIEDGRLYVVDNSTNGTFVDEEAEENRLESGRRVVLEEARRLVIADFEIRFRLGERQRQGGDAASASVDQPGDEEAELTEPRGIERDDFSAFEEMMKRRAGDPD